MDSIVQCGVSTAWASKLPVVAYRYASVLFNEASSAQRCNLSCSGQLVANEIELRLTLDSAREKRKKGKKKQINKIKKEWRITRAGQGTQE